jgi:hypothetical protein
MVKTMKLRNLARLRRPSVGPEAIALDSVTGASPQTRAVFWRAGVEVSFVHDRAELGTATLYSGATTRSAQPSASIVVRF